MILAETHLFLAGDHKLREELGRGNESEECVNLLFSFYDKRMLAPLHIRFIGKTVGTLPISMHNDD